MAQRQKAVTEPILDNSMLNEFPSEGDSKIVHALTQGQFNSIIRNLKNKPLDTIQPICTCTFFALRRLKVGRDLEEAVPGIPKGSDHFDFLSFKLWVEKIKPTDADSIAQLVKIDATAKTRLIG